MDENKRMNSYLIPANSKKSMLIFSIFNKTDMWIVIFGIITTFLLLILLNVGKFWMAILAVSPGLICAFLVFPVPNYHNIRTVIKNAWVFFTTRQRYIWKGWCFEYGEREEK